MNDADGGFWQLLNCVDAPVIAKSFVPRCDHGPAGAAQQDQFDLALSFCIASLTNSPLPVRS
jgi:hypothetical protein